jgi:hypothetical protein
VNLNEKINRLLYALQVYNVKEGQHFADNYLFKSILKGKT